MSNETFTSLVDKNASAEDIAQHLDALEPHQRVKEVLAFPGRLQSRLFETVKGKHQIDINDFVGPSDQTIIYELKNSLPMLNIAQKRFFKPPEGEIVGYNHNTGVATLAGPGYFYAVNGDDGEIVFDYTRLPTFRPDGWPEIKPNGGIIPRITFADMLDYTRMVSKTTAIGEAYRHGKSRKQWFLLTRSVEQS